MPAPLQDVALQRRGLRYWWSDLFEPRECSSRIIHPTRTGPSAGATSPQLSWLTFVGEPVVGVCCALGQTAYERNLVKPLATHGADLYLDTDVDRPRKEVTLYADRPYDMALAGPEQAPDLIRIRLRGRPFRSNQVRYRAK